MNEAIERMLGRYACTRHEDYVRALREILQEIALFGLWRSRFYENAAFYGGTALRILYGLDRFSEDLDFTLIKPDSGYRLDRYLDALKKEIRSFGFEPTVSARKKEDNPVQSGFLKLDTQKHLLEIDTPRAVAGRVPKGQVIKIKLEIDTRPPSDFTTESKYLLNPVPFSVRTVALPDLFAGKMHAVLCRQWKTRVKGRDWYDLVWYCGNHPDLHLGHLEKRMIQSGHLAVDEILTREKFIKRFLDTVDNLDVAQAKAEVEPFITRPEALSVWSKEFFADLATKIKFV